MKSIMKKLGLLLLFGITFSSVTIGKVNAQSYLSDKTETNYTSEDGLVTGKANAVTCMQDGTIYFGQYVGLTRYDSKSFSEPETGADYGYDFTSISDLDSISNELYFGTYKGAFSYIDGSYQKIMLDEGDIKINDITHTTKYIYFSTNLGLYSYARLDDDINNVKKGNIKKIVDKNNIIDSAFLSDNSFYYVTTMQDSNYNVVFYSNGTNNDSSDDIVYYSYLDEGINIKLLQQTDSNLYMCSNSGVIIRTNVSRNQASQMAQKKVFDLGYETAINDIQYYGVNLYVATGQGLFIIDSEYNIEFVDDLKATSNLEDITFDYMGNLWIVSSTSGVSKITTNLLVNFIYGYNTNISNVNAVEYYNGYYYIASDTEGLYIMDGITKANYQNDLVLALKDLRIRDLEVFNDKLYIAVYDSNVYSLIEYDGINDTFINIDSKTLSQTDETNSYARNVRCLTQNNGILYIGTNYGITSLTFDDDNNRIFKVTKTITENNSKLRPLYLTCFNDKLYACMDQSGINVYPLDLNTSDSESFVSGISPLKISKINDMIVYNDQGILYYVKDGVTKKCNINFVGAIVEILYFDNSYIIGTDTGIYLVDDITLDNPNVTIINQAFGFDASLIANSSGYYDIDTNSYLFVTTKGVYQLYLGKMITSPDVKVKLTGVTEDGTNVLSDNIKISSNTKEIKIQFNVFAYGNDNKYKVYYKLNGFDDDYQELSSYDKFEVTYQNLKGGDYQFDLYVKMSDGSISKNTISFEFTKTKKIYENIWFWIVIVIVGLICFGLLNYIIINYRIRKAIERQNEYRKITIESIEAIARTIDAKDSYTNGHSVRVGYYSRLIAKELGYSGEEVDNIYYTALLHDIGKIAIPLTVLNKPGRLTDEEFAIMKSHTTEGAKILHGITTIPNIADGAKYHHERYDGRGYPEGLKGEEIPLIARIICCADCFDAMATKRVYKDPYPLDKIVSEFENCSGTQFDPEIAKIVVKLIHEGKLKNEERKDKSMLEFEIEEKLHDIDEANKKQGA